MNESMDSKFLNLAIKSIIGFALSPGTEVEPICSISIKFVPAKLLISRIRSIANVGHSDW